MGDSNVNEIVLILILILVFVAFVLCLFAFLLRCIFDYHNMYIHKVYETIEMNNNNNSSTVIVEQ